VLDSTCSAGPASPIRLSSAPLLRLAPAQPYIEVMADLEARITELWERRDELGHADESVRETIHEAINQLDSGKARVAELVGDDVVVHQWCKQAILLLFRTAPMNTVEVGPFEYADKIPLKEQYERLGVRVVPGASARWGSYLAPGVIMMPSYVNIGAYVGENTMVDTWATVGSCAQIGRNVHLSGGVGIGGVLEPQNAAPVMIGDECYIGSRCIVAEGAVVGEGTVLGAGAILTASIPVIDADTGEELSRGVVPPWSVAVAATRPRRFAGGDFGLACVLVIKRLTAGERHDKSALNDILRGHGATV
jgi:2,3,4,5-tetrahydropyridine-2-carboxylate N-succinyltransferase